MPKFRKGQGWLLPELAWARTGVRPPPAEHRKVAPEPSARLASARVILLWIVTWVIVALLSWPLLIQDGQVALFLRGGLSMALLMWAGLRYAPLVLISWVVTLPLVSQFPSTSLTLTIARAVIIVGSMVAGCLLLRQSRVDTRLRRLRDVVLFLTLGVFLPVCVQGLLQNAMGLAVLERVLPSLVSLVSVTPFLLINVVPLLEPRGTESQLARKPRLAPHPATILAVSACIWIMVWVANVVESRLNLSLYFVCFFPLVWIAYRYGLPMTTWVIFTSALGIAVLHAFAWPETAINNSRAAVVFCSVAGLVLGAFVEERWQSEDVVQRLAWQIPNRTGREFFEAVAANLAQMLEADFVVAGELIPDRRRVRTLAFWVDGKQAPNIEYDLADTPCAEVMNGAACTFASGVRERFPRDRMLTESGVESYAGTPLLSSTGKALGLMLVMYRRPMEKTAWIEAGLAAFGARASAELERLQNEEALQQSEQRYKAFVTNSQESVWRIEFEPPVPVDLPHDELVERIANNGYLADINDFGARLRGFDRAEDLKGLPLKVLMEREGIPMDTILMAARSGFQPSSGVFPLTRPDGRVVQVKRSGFGVVENGLLLRFWGTGQDVTELMEAQEEIRKLNAGLEERVARRTHELHAAVKELEAFSYSVSHDLRAPLLGILGSSRVLAEDYSNVLDPAGQEWLGRVREDAAYMDSLLDSLLALSRVTRSDVCWLDVDLSDVAEGVVSNLQQHEPARHVDIMVERNLHVVGDPALLRVAMENLLGNAWKFSRTSAAARIEVGRTLSGAYYVRDTGAGFDPRYADRLFTAFQRLHGAEFEGTGIGLATVQRVIHRHGGEVWAESQVGVGATFYFTLGLPEETRG